MGSPHSDLSPCLDSVPCETTLIGRTAECARLDRLLLDVRSGRSAVLVLRGRPGVGRTALLEHVARRAQDFRVVRVCGVKSETELPYAGLHLFAGRLRDSLGCLQAPHREALEAAVGLTTGPRPDRFLVSLATLRLFTEAAATQPLLCIVDDAQWLDRQTANVLSFVFRRLGAQPVGFLVAQREPYRPADVDGLPELVLGGLSRADARTLFRSVVPGRVDDIVVARIIAETRGNPLALLDVVRDASPDGFAGGFGVGTGLVPDPDESAFEPVTRLAADSRLLLLAAAAEPIGDPTLHWRAAAHLGIPYEAAEPLVSEGLLSFFPRVIFGRPSLRAAVYRLASREERRVVHRALAEATDPASDPDRRGWHLAHAAEGPDDELARELERCAPSAHERGGVAAAAAFLERAALLTLDQSLRTERLLAAAAAKHRAGAPDAATRLLVTAEMGSSDRARLERQRAQVAFASTRHADATDRLLRAARELDPVMPDLARETYLEALTAATFAGRCDPGCGAVEVARAARGGAPGPAPRRAVDCLLDAMVSRFTDGYTTAAVPLAGALLALESAGSADETALWFYLACQAAADLWDDQAWHDLTTRQVTTARDVGALTVLPYALTCRALADVHFGNLAAASALVGEAVRSAPAENSPSVHAALLVAGWRGQERSARDQFENARRDGRDRGEGLLLTMADLSAAVLYNGLGRYSEAFEAAREAGELDELGVSGWVLTELIEAAVRSGDREAAALAVKRLSERARVSGTEWALGIDARSRALLSDEPTAEALYLEGIERLGRSRIRGHLGRAHLVYGEWLRRRRRRVDARVHLRAAREVFVAVGAEAFAERAQRELLATGERARRRTVGARDQLTAQEARVAHLVLDGLTNPEIGTRLFVSPRTVEYHLHKVFTKLGITSRAELHLVFRPDR